MDTETAVSLATLPALVVGVVQLLKGAGVPTTWAPIAAVLVGMVLRVGVAYAARQPVGGPELVGFLLEGGVIGLAAAGLYSGVQTLADRPPGGT